MCPSRIKEEILLSDEGFKMFGIQLEFKNLFLSSLSIISNDPNTCMLIGLFYFPTDVLSIWSTDTEVATHAIYFSDIYDLLRDFKCYYNIIRQIRFVSVGFLLLSSFYNCIS